MKRERLVQFLLMGLPFGFVMGLQHGFQYGVYRGVIGGTISGVLFGIGMSYFFSSFSKRQKIKMESENGVFENEVVIHEGPANHFLKLEGRGGWLTLTKTQLAFRAHGKNIQNLPLTIPISDIALAQPSATAKLFQNGLCVLLIKRQ
jgi:hypothetical protein